MELKLIRQMLDGVIRGSSGTLFVEGEAGIGKSELVRALMRSAAEEGVHAIPGGAHPFDRNRPFGLIADALELRPHASDQRRAAMGRLLSGAEAQPGSQDARHRIIEAVVDLAETLSRDAPLLVVLEDLHWADASSVMAIGAMVHRLQHAPVLLVCTLRPAPRSEELDVLLDDCLAASARLVHLRALTAEEVTELVRAEVGGHPGPALAAIVEKAAGNPLWAIEILRSLSSEGWLRHDDDVVEAAADELPGSFRELVVRRLGYLPRPALDVLRLAAVLGDAVSIQDIAVVTGRQPRDVLADLEEAFRAQLLDHRAEAVVFRHQLVQQSIYEDMPVPARRAFHRDVARSLARAGADLAQVATHLVAGADRGDLEAVELLRRGAAEASTGAPAVAVDLLSYARELLPAGHADTDLIAAELADAMQQAGRVADAAYLAASVLDRPHLPEVDVALRLTLVSALSLLNRTQELIDRAFATLELGSLDPAQEALVLTQASYGQSFSGDFVGGEATARRARDLADRAADAGMAVWSRCALSLATRTQGRYAEALALAEDAVSRAFEPPDSAARLRFPHFFLAMALADSDRGDEALATYARAIEESEQLGAAWLLPDMLHLAAEARFVAGEWDDAAAEFEAGLTLGRQHGQQISIAQTRAYQALIATGRGDFAGARAALHEVAGELTSTTPVYGSELVAFAAAAATEAEGDPRAAFDLLWRFWQYDQARDIRYYHRYLGPALVRLAVLLDNRDAGAQVVLAVEAAAALAPEVPTVQSAALRCRGLLDRQPRPLIDAVEFAEQGGRFLDHAGSCEDAASVLAGVGRDDDAKAFLLTAHALYDGAEADACVARVNAALRRLGLRQGVRGQRRRDATGWGSLTKSETSVAKLVAEGLTNRDAAGRLHISPHTVNTHLRHVFQKLAVTTRAELAAKFAKDGITHTSDVSRG